MHVRVGSRLKIPATCNTEQTTVHLPTFYWPLVLATLATLQTSFAWAQTRYTCRQPNGSYTVSDRPCAASTGLTYYPPLSPGHSYSNIPKAGLAPDHLQYLSPHCSAMNDAIRTSGVRGLNYQAVSELQRNYQRECSENESEARNRYWQERGEASKARSEAKQSALQAQQQADMAQQQCDESKRIIANKKRRGNLNEGEQAELERFEANIRARCR